MWNGKNDASQNMIVASLSLIFSFEFVTHIQQFMLMKNMDKTQMLFKRTFLCVIISNESLFIHCLISNGGCTVQFKVILSIIIKKTPNTEN